MNTVENELQKRFRLELAGRIVRANPDPETQEFALYVCWARRLKRITRATLAQRAGLRPDFLLFLQNELLTPGELTEEVCSKIESALGVSYRMFLRVLERERHKDSADAADDLNADSNLEIVGYGSESQPCAVAVEIQPETQPPATVAPSCRCVIRSPSLNPMGDDALMSIGKIPTQGCPAKEFSPNMTYRIQGLLAM